MSEMQTFCHLHSKTCPPGRSLRLYFWKKYSRNFFNIYVSTERRKMTNLKAFSSFKVLLGLRSLLNSHLYPVGAGSEMRAAPQLESGTEDRMGGISRCMKPGTALVVQSQHTKSIDSTLAVW